MVTLVTNEVINVRSSPVLHVSVSYFYPILTKSEFSQQILAKPPQYK